MIAMTGSALADTTTKPYLKTFGGDLMTGGWFRGTSGCANNYQNPTFSSPTFNTDNRNGGILSYYQSSPKGGASSQYGVMALGEVDGRRAGDGFYSSGVQNSASVKALTFANTDGTLPYGGVLEGSVDQSHCVPDYFSKVNRNNPSVQALQANWRSVLINAGGDGTYYGDAPSGNSYDLFGSSGSGDVTVKTGKRVTIFVNGSVYISQNIIYDPGSSVDSTPKFALIAKGSIYVDPNVTRLDGFYVAQPKDNTAASLTADTGIFWSCHGSSLSQTIDIYYPAVNCTRTLVINGGVVAKQLNLLRVKGDVSGATGAEDSIATVSSCTPPGTCNVAEVFNYTPAVLTGGSFFDTNNSGSSNVLPIDSLISLPPVF